VSLLHLSSPTTGQEFKLACTSFQTMLYSEISSVQTKTMVQHFPVKAQQPEVNFELIFRNEPEYEQFQKFVRSHQLAALYDWPHPEVVLWWPERDIKNWTGLIKTFKAGGARRNYTPRARLTVDLIDSVFYSRTDIASAAASVWAILGEGLNDGILSLPSVLGSLSEFVGGSAFL
jgi:hypothetical protein